MQIRNHRRPQKCHSTTILRAHSRSSNPQPPSPHIHTSRSKTHTHKFHQPQRVNRNAWYRRSGGTRK
ncbi:hypothetical protein BDQ17DRAFT_1361526 [Cyathus striatus]|nr:hypothetical protein BDQ17DRAFT_1361526 [Cyathus striatus]